MVYNMPYILLDMDMPPCHVPLESSMSERVKWSELNNSCRPYFGQQCPFQGHGLEPIFNKYGKANGISLSMIRIKDTLILMWIGKVLAIWPLENTEYLDQMTMHGNLGSQRTLHERSTVFKHGIFECLQMVFLHQRFTKTVVFIWKFSDYSGHCM